MKSILSGMAPQYDYLQEVATSIPCPSRSQFCSNNVEMLDSSNNKYRRCLFIRYVPGEISTPDTSAEGLRVLAAFLKDNICSRYPPADITTIDGTNVENPHSLPCFVPQALGRAALSRIRSFHWLSVTDFMKIRTYVNLYFFCLSPVLYFFIS